ncbi:hypothetical protein NIES4103_31370 [Nostoc sp. NIES-4103]|nr:hypothetical protein NIES4103_31370 [Nostoc sp. NIES-4103]
MFKFDGETKGVKLILERIENNKYTTEKPNGEYLTHKEVRSFARCLLAVLPSLKIFSKEAEIKLLLAALSASGLPHYDRSFLASQILNLLEKDEEENSSSVENF